MHETDCTVCGKTEARLKSLCRSDGWECSHIDCPNRKPVPDQCDHQEYMLDGCYRVRTTSQD